MALGHRLGHGPAVPAAGHAGRRVGLQLHAGYGGQGGELLHQRHRLGPAGGGAGGEEGGDVAAQVGVHPGGGVGRHPGQGLGHDPGPVDAIQARQPRGGGDHLDGLHAGGGGLGPPVGPQGLGVAHGVLGRAAVHRRPPLQAVQGPGVGLGAVVVFHPPGHQLAQALLHLGGPGREHPEHLGGDALDVGVAVGDRSPVHAQAGGQLRAQGRRIDPADAALLALQEPGIEGQPAAALVLDLGHHDGVGVQLGVGGAAGVLAEQGHGQPLVSTWSTPSVPRRVTRRRRTGRPPRRRRGRRPPRLV